MIVRQYVSLYQNFPQPVNPFIAECVLLLDAAARWGLLHYCQISNIRHTKFPKLNASRLVLWLSLPNPLKPGVKSRMKM